MNITRARLAYICNDLENIEDYKINDDGSCYHKGIFIGDIAEKMDDGIFRILFKPKKPLEYINITFAITDEGIEF